MSGQDHLIGTLVLDSAGAELGRVSALLVDPQTLQGRWLQVELADRRPNGSAVIPLAAASLNPDGVIQLPWTAGTVAGAPQVGSQVSPEQVHTLNAYYDLDL